MVEVSQVIAPCTQNYNLFLIKKNVHVNVSSCKRPINIIVKMLPMFTGQQTGLCRCASGILQSLTRTLAANRQLERAIEGFVKMVLVGYVKRVIVG